MDPDHLIRHSQKRQCHPAVRLFSNVQVHREMFARDVHHTVPPVDGGGHQGVTDRHSLDEVEDTQYDCHDDDLRMAIEPSCAGYDRHDNLDMRNEEGFRAVFLANPQRQCQRKPQWWSERERGVSKPADPFWKVHRRCRITLRIFTVGLRQRTGRAERRERSTGAFRA